MTERIKKYIDDHAVGSELLFRDWESFLDLLYAEGGRISSILWWDYCTKKQLHDSVGSGGYKDPENEEYLYAETQLAKEGLETYTLDDIKEYINKERKTGFRYGDKYKSHDLVPSFCLVNAAKPAKQTEKKGNNWTAYYDPDTGRYFAEIMYTSREGREQYDYEISEDIYNRLGTFSDDIENERLIKTAKITYSFENTMYGTLGPERTVWDEEANEVMRAAEAKRNTDPGEKE